MAKAYSITSDPFYVNGNVTETGANAFTQQEISLPLDSLNREGIIVHAVYFSGEEPERIANALSQIRMQVTSTSKTAMVGVNDANLLSRQEKYIAGGAGEFSGPHVIDVVASATAPSTAKAREQEINITDPRPSFGYRRPWVSVAPQPLPLLRTDTASVGLSCARRRLRLQARRFPPKWLPTLDHR